VSPSPTRSTLTRTCRSSSAKNCHCHLVGASGKFETSPAPILERSLSGVAYYPDVLDPVACDVEREHRHAARTRIKDLIPDGASVFTGASETLRLSGSLVVASASGSQLPSYAGGAARAIWIVGAQKVVADLSTALRRVEDHCLPLESARAQVAYGWPSAISARQGPPFLLRPGQQCGEVGGGQGGVMS